MNRNFIVVDDDAVNNLICRKVINHVFPKADVQIFINPETALTYIKSIYSESIGKRTILFLDINMPVLSGWDFLEEFENFDKDIKEQLKIYMLSSSIDQLDKDRATKNKNVSGYIEKPLNQKIIAKMLF
ncbi:response regulator [Flavobacterium maritimum]|uniref:response regulator n=1 Tax=Flavobacterium maritimum TaxID=3149042 RepID=UPI0032B4A169